MRTGRSLTVYCSLLRGGLLGPGGWCLPGPGGGGLILLGPGGVCAWSRRGVLLGPGGVLLGPGGSPWSGGVSLVLGGCLPGPRRVSLVLGGFSLVGGSPWSRGGVPAWSRGVLQRPPLNRITDTCKNITLATTSLQPVKMFLIDNLFKTVCESRALVPLC